MIKRLGIVLGLLMLGSLGQAAASEPVFESSFKEYKLVCAGDSVDLTRQVNATRMTNDHWRLVGLPIITKDGPNLIYCQMLYRYM